MNGLEEGQPRIEDGFLFPFQTTHEPMMRLPFPTAALLLALSPFSQAAITSYGADFNSGSGSLTDFFLRTGDNPAAGVTWNATAGVGGGGGLLVTNGTTDNFFYRPGTPSDATSALDFSALTVGQGFSSSVDFLWSNSSSTDLTSLNAGFSITRPNNALSAGSETASFISGSLIRNTPDPNLVQLRIRSHNATPFSKSFVQTTLEAGEWYRMTFQATMNGDGTIANLLTLYSIGANGLATPVVVDSISGNVTNDMVADSATVYSAYDIRNVNSNGIDAVDNFNVSFIPEPSAIALVALGGVAMAGRRRRC